MSKYLTRAISLILSFSLIIEQSLFAQAIDFSRYLANPANAVIQDNKFRPLHLRYLGYDNLSNDFKILLDKGDTRKEDLENKAYLEENTQTLLKYFLIGLALPNDKFWVNLRPDSPDDILDPLLEKTDIGRIFLEADVQLKKDTSGLTSPQTKEGKDYWDKLYKKAGELFGTENTTIPTLTRPWIVPNEIIIRESPEGAYIYKATLKVMLEEDYLSGRGGSRTAPTMRTAPTSDQYAFFDPRLKELNQYSTQLIKENIIPKLTYQVNTSKRYAQLRQVYYSLILAQWFKARYRSPGSQNPYAKLIDSGELTNLTIKKPYNKQAYFKQYQKSFQDGEYNLQEPISTPLGQSVRRYMSGGLILSDASSAVEGVPGKDNPIHDFKKPYLIEAKRSISGSPMINDTLGTNPDGKQERTPDDAVIYHVAVPEMTQQEHQLKNTVISSDEELKIKEMLVKYGIDPVLLKWPSDDWTPKLVYAKVFFTKRGEDLIKEKEDHVALFDFFWSRNKLSEKGLPESLKEMIIDNREKLNSIMGSIVEGNIKGDVLKLLNIVLRDKLNEDKAARDYLDSIEAFHQNKKGGIDFTSPSIITQSINSLQSLVSGPMSISPDFDFDKEWAQIQQIFNADIHPSVKRLVEFSVAVSGKPAESRRKKDVIGLIIDLLRDEEEDGRLTPADPAMKVLLGALDGL